MTLEAKGKRISRTSFSGRQEEKKASTGQRGTGLSWEPGPHTCARNRESTVCTGAQVRTWGCALTASILSAKWDEELCGSKRDREAGGVDLRIREKV